ncbi:MAG TPA: glucosyl-3-phosphoglycerate synthase [Solirubrobacteraceae bacterium]|jgi:glycosyltransferase involved in cell wall biosynthesis|nr:glucosyl-3-phosphoglycerate synthase [Solirubrobacteraceae bacterium]
MGVDAVVVIPARDEEARIEGCLRALASQTLAKERFATVVVLDSCRDRTAEVVTRVAGELGLAVTTLAGPGEGAGAARRIGMNAACDQLLSAGVPQGLIACTDADSRPTPDWLDRQLEHVASGARAIAGLIELEADEAGLLPAGVMERRARDAEARLEQVRSVDPAADHHHAAGASLAVTAETYREVGGIEPLRALEDAGFAERLAQYQVPLLRPADVRVVTSARADGRVARGLSVDLALSTWFERRRYRAGDFGADQLRACKRATTVTVIVPAKECADTVAGVLRQTVEPLSRAGLVDEVVVVDAASADATGEIAARAGARVLQQDQIAPELGPALGKGDAMWRALRETSGDVVCFLDADTVDPNPDHLLGLLGPILTDESVALVKGAFERPLDTGTGKIPHEGGRVTELMARPLLNLHAPLLAGFAQPLAGEIAARRDLLEQLPFPVGYGVEIAMLVDALHIRGLDALAECDLGTRQNRHQPLRALGEMAYAVLAAVENRVPERAASACASGARYMRPWEDGLVASVPVKERPPIRARDRPASRRLTSSA